MLSKLIRNVQKQKKNTSKYHGKPMKDQFSRAKLWITENNTKYDECLSEIFLDMNKLSFVFLIRSEQQGTSN